MIDDGTQGHGRVLRALKFDVRSSEWRRDQAVSAFGRDAYDRIIKGDSEAIPDREDGAEPCGRHHSAAHPAAADDRTDRESDASRARQ